MTHSTIQHSDQPQNLGALPQTSAAHQETGEQGEGNAIFGEPISIYSRWQALQDGVLLDVTDMAEQAGFRCPVALTRAAWADCVEWSEQDSKRQTHQDESGRLWDILWMASVAARRGGCRTAFQFYRVPRGGRGTKPRLTTLVMHAGPGDNGELVITIMMPDED